MYFKKKLIWLSVVKYQFEAFDNVNITEIM